MTDTPNNTKKTKFILLILKFLYIHGGPATGTQQEPDFTHFEIQLAAASVATQAPLVVYLQPPLDELLLDDVVELDELLEEGASQTKPGGTPVELLPVLLELEELPEAG